MRFSVINFFWPKPPANLQARRQELVALENDPQQFSRLLNRRIGRLVDNNQYDEAWLLIGYFKNRRVCGQAAITAAIELVDTYSELDKHRDSSEYYILAGLLLVLKMMPTLNPGDSMQEDMAQEAIFAKAVVVAWLLIFFLTCARERFVDMKIVGKRLSTTSDEFTQDFISHFTTRLAGLFEEDGSATVEAAAERVCFAFQIKALEANSGEFHQLWVDNLSAAVRYLEDAFGDQLVNVIPDANDPTKIQIMVRYRSAEKCAQLIHQVDSLALDDLNRVAMPQRVSNLGLGQRA